MHHNFLTALLSFRELGSIMHSRPENSLMKVHRSQRCHIIVAPSADIAAQADLERLDDDVEIRDVYSGLHL